jgi:hypothetical protein
MSIILRVDGLLGKMTGTVYGGQVTSRCLVQGESGVPEDRRQDIVEIVRHTARQRAKGLKLLRLSKLLL